jgi:hypothetical protein
MSRVYRAFARTGPGSVRGQQSLQGWPRENRAAAVPRGCDCGRCVAEARAVAWRRFVLQRVRSGYASALRSCQRLTVAVSAITDQAFAGTSPAVSSYATWLEQSLWPLREVRPSTSSLLRCRLARGLASRGSADSYSDDGAGSSDDDSALGLRSVVTRFQPVLSGQASPLAPPVPLVAGDPTRRVALGAGQRLSLTAT